MVFSRLSIREFIFTFLQVQDSNTAALSEGDCQNKEKK